MEKSKPPKENLEAEFDNPPTYDTIPIAKTSVVRRGGEITDQPSPEQQEELHEH
jgi:hypothetical protein